MRTNNIWILTILTGMRKSKKIVSTWLDELLIEVLI